jgi:hypothetical protein
VPRLPNRDETAGICGIPRRCAPSPKPLVSSGFAGVRSEPARLKMVVSPVRVRVSPFAIPHGSRTFFFSDGARWPLIGHSIGPPARRSWSERPGAESQCSCGFGRPGQRPGPHDSRHWCSRFEDRQRCYVGCGSPPPQSLTRVGSGRGSFSCRTRVRLAELLAPCRWRRTSGWGSRWSICCARACWA